MDQKLSSGQTADGIDKTGKIITSSIKSKKIYF
jgi:hypothetical protein